MTAGAFIEEEQKSLSEVHSSVPVPAGASFLRKLLAFSGPGYLVAVGYMDPGNWATDLSGGAKFGYSLLFVILISNIVAILLQHLALKLGIATGKDLAQACRDYPKPVRIGLWVMAEIMIIACDLAEVIGSAIALNLLFHIPLAIGVVITAADVLLILMLQKKGFRYLEALIIALIGTIVVAFGLELILSRPEIASLLAGFIPTAAIFSDKEMLYIALGIIGATVMPHNLFLHSSVVQTRAFVRDLAGKKEAVKFATIDTVIALMGAFFVNAAILIMSASVFHFSGHSDVADIDKAYELLTPLLGTSLASIVFALALLASGQNSTLTGTLTGQIIMEGFLNLKMRAWLRRIITRLLAIIPALAVILFFQDFGVGKLLILSQVVLSIQLPFAVVPLVMFTSNKKEMGSFVNRLWLKVTAYVIALCIVVLNMWLIYNLFFG
ncbi:MAG: divalent metal cation transporter [Candidatus Taylorbacteria bacterium RIFCSPHIGHO2_02_FULL_46_13]|uniref:Divalent metal cation transporter MntH n=1 Tax=Candidatus Taylorbacteria bacterium RIFCSPHIGHO2_02_FULL_46_13 TaxID=1802312 RepID=A0A1G2MTT0_9BACT|nr:MAG: divalent metal cation transporter [Candidatus Taylorbacteria bacterium RIFCSPHIGHO2_02_FULL_46_13]